MLLFAKISLVVSLLFFLSFPAIAASDTVDVVAEGVSAIRDGNLVQARDVAVSDALRAAVEQAVGTMVNAQTKVQNYTVIQDSVLTRTNGYVARYQVLKTWLEDGILHVQVSAAVKQGEIRNDLVALRLILDGAGDPRVMVLIPEQHISRPVPDPAAETEIIKQLSEAGIRLVDQKTANRAASNETIRRALAGDTDVVRSLASQYQADILVIGEAFSEYVGNFSGLISCRARVEVRVVRADTGEILAANGVHESGVDITEATAAKKALAKAGSTMAEYLKSAIPKKLVQAELTIQVSVTGLSFTEVRKLESALRAIHLVSDVEMHDFVNGLALFNVRTSLRPAQLADELLRQELKLDVTGVSGAKLELKKIN